MDEIVKQALAKWPNVPHCTGWLLLDRRVVSSITVIPWLYWPLAGLLIAHARIVSVRGATQARAKEPAESQASLQAGS